MAIGEIPAHTHSGTTESSGNHTHSVKYTWESQSGSDKYPTYVTPSANINTGYENIPSAGAHTHSLHRQWASTQHLTTISSNLSLEAYQLSGTQPPVNCYIWLHIVMSTISTYR